MEKGGSAKTSTLHFSYTQTPFSFKVTRSETGEVLFDTSSAPLVFEPQFLQLRTKLSSASNLYGLGEHSDVFRLPTENYKRTLWNAESPFVPRGSNLYGSHPVYFDHRGNSGTHGVFLLSSAGMDVNIYTTSSGDRYLEYNTIGGVFDFYFLAGPTPVEVSRQYAEMVGLPAMIPFWTLGFHQCKYGYQDIDTVETVVANYSAAGIPLETMWGDIDYMDSHQDFSTDPQRYPLQRMRRFVEQLRRNNQHYVVILDPGIRHSTGYSTFNNGVQRGAFLKNADGSVHRGRQWAGEVVWPDWLAPGSQAWWTNEIMSFFDPTTGLDVDGLWVDMNEASNMCGEIDCFPPVQATPPGRHRRLFGPFASQVRLRKGLAGRNLLFPPYSIANHLGPLWRTTLLTNLTNADGTTQYDTHNLYGHLMAQHTRNALLARRPLKRPFVLTRSTFAGSGAHAAHWFGDNASTWSDYLLAIRQMLAFSALHAMPMVGSDVCGFNGDAEEELCARWAMLGAFQPFYRNHADVTAPAQEFYRWDVVATAARKAIDARYRLLDYVYTAMERASRDGTPVARPLWFAWPGDEETFGIETQWLWGEALVVSPVTEKGTGEVRVYLPPGEVFYDFWTRKRVWQRDDGWTLLIGVTFTDIPVHVRQGSVVPMRVRGGNTTAEVRRENFEILVAPGEDGTAKGTLYLDDGESLDVGQAKSEIKFLWAGGRFVMSGTFGFDTDLVVEKLTVMTFDGGEPMVMTGQWGLKKGIEFV